MYIKNIELENFRNYFNLKINFHDKLNIFIGENGQGKTNILEGVFFSSVLKSHRTSKNIDLINIEKKYSHIKVNAIKNNFRTLNINIGFNIDGKKTIEVNGFNVKKFSEIIGKIKIVMFSPEDLKIIKDSPAIRRKFIDMNISQLDFEYLDSIIKYNKVLKMRNNVLKSTNINDSLLDVYDEQISLYMYPIIKKRSSYIKMLNEFCCPILKEISNERENLNIYYKTFLDIKDCNKDDIKNNIIEILIKNRQKDKFKKVSTVGIHKDDFLICMNDKNCYSYSSQGQQRSIVIALKLGIVRIIEKITKECPVLLLDDILSELDYKRRSFILNFIKDVQTFITCTDLNDIVLGDHKIFKINNGFVIGE